MDTAEDKQPGREFTSAEMGALAHLYRGEIYRSTTWRTRLDTTTNWSVVTLGIALSLTFSSPSASALPLLLVGILILFFLLLEARRYRYFNVCRARSRWLETNLYAQILRDGKVDMGTGWAETLADDYLHPQYHIGLATAVGRRIKRNYLWILLIQTAAYIGKLVVHPAPVSSVGDFVLRADIGPIPGEAVLALGVAYVGSWIAVAVWSARSDAERFRRRGSSSSSIG